jgi:hypothetical protein
MTETDISKVLIEGEYATIMGVKYKRVGEPKPQTLYNRLYDELGYDFEDIENVVDLVEDWLPLEGCHELKSYDYSAGWNDCLQKIKENLR